MNRAHVFYLAGPTGAGKSAVAVAVAEAVGAEIVNADAFQLYRGLERLTAAPTEAERAWVPHHLYGVLDLSDSCDAARYASMAQEVLAGLAARGVPAVVVGGSGLYLKALTHGLSDAPRDAALRAALAERPLEDKVAELRELDPVGAAAMNLTNPRHVERALEICRLTGRPASLVRSVWSAPDPPDLRGVLLIWERAALYARIDQRVAAMFAGGVVEEVAAVVALERAAAAAGGRFLSSSAETIIGMREIRGLLAGTAGLAEVVAAIQQATRRYAKRQLTWFRREWWMKTVCLGGDETPDSAAAAIIREFFHDRGSGSSQ